MQKEQVEGVLTGAGGCRVGWKTVHKSQECPCVKTGGACQALIGDQKDNGRRTQATTQSRVEGGDDEAKIETLCDAGKFSPF